MSPFFESTQFLLYRHGAFARLFGYASPEEFMAEVRTAGQVFADPSRRANLIDTLEMGQAMLDVENRYRRRDGSEFTGHLLLQAVKDSGGRISFLEGYIQDVTASKKLVEDLRQSEERYQRMLTTANEGVLMVDAQSCITFANRRLEEILGHSASELVGQPVETFLFVEDLPDHALQYISRQRGETGTYERRFLRQDGSQGWAFVSATPILDEAGVYQGSFGLISDITARKQAEKERDATLGRLRALYEVTQELAAIYDQRAVLKKAVFLTAGLFNDTCVLSLISANRRQLEPLAFHDQDPDVEYFVKILLGSTSYEMGTGIAGRVAQSGEAVLINNLPVEEMRSKIQPGFLAYLERFTIYNLLIVPLQAGGRVLGTLGVVRSRPRQPYTQADQLFLQDLASRVALTLAAAKKRK